MSHTKKPSPDQAHKNVAWFGVPHLHRRHLHGGGTNARIRPRGWSSTRNRQAAIAASAKPWRKEREL